MNCGLSPPHRLHSFSIGYRLDLGTSPVSQWRCVEPSGRRRLLRTQVACNWCSTRTPWQRLTLVSRGVDRCRNRNVAFMFGGTTWHVCTITSDGKWRVPHTKCMTRHKAQLWKWISQAQPMRHRHMECKSEAFALVQPMCLPKRTSPSALRFSDVFWYQPVSGFES